MLTDNKKLIREIRSIIECSEKAKKFALAEIDKIDAKYRALAEKEKSELNDTIKLLDSQITKYSSILAEDSVDDEPETPAVEQETEDTVPAEEEVVDTLFPENNEGSVSEPEHQDDAETETVTEWPSDNDLPGNDAEADDTSTDEEWPDFVQEWK